MSLTVTPQRSMEQIHGSRRRTVTDLAFDSSYALGGESLTPRQLGLSIVESVTIQPKYGYAFEYDIANQKLVAKRPGPALVDEATGTFTAGLAYQLQYLPAYILAIRGTAGSTGTKRLIPTGETLAAGQCSLNFATGVITWGDAAITAARIVYVPLGVPGFTSDLVVVDEAAPIASNVITLANQAAAINYIWNDEDNEILGLIPVGETPSGAACAVDIDDGSGATKITVTTGRIADGTATKVSYIKRSGNPLRFVDQADRTVTSNIAGPGTDVTFDVAGLVLPGYGQVIVGEASGGANLQALLTDPDGTAAANVAVFNPWRNTITFTSGDAYVTAEIPLLYLQQELVQALLLDVPYGTNLTALAAVRVVAEGF